MFLLIKMTSGKKIKKLLWSSSLVVEERVRVDRVFNRKGYSCRGGKERRVRR
jgi:hypothetical protein